MANCALGEYHVEMSPSVYGCNSAILDATVPIIHYIEALQPACMEAGKSIICWMAETSEPIGQSVGNCPVAKWNAYSAL